MTTNLLRYLLFGAFLLLLRGSGAAQTPDDGFWMEKGQICTAVPYTFDRWSEYWEGTLKRDNPNLGVVSRQSVSPMFSLGLFKKINLIMAVPYVWTQTSAGTLAGHRGLQDWSVFLKGKAATLGLGASKFLVFATAGFSTPASKYYPDYLPVSIGLGSTNFYLKGILHLETPTGLFASFAGGFTYRSNIRLERNYYYTSAGGFSTDAVQMPNIAEYRAAAGFVNTQIKTNLIFVHLNTLGGADIRRNDAPFPSYNMDQSRIGAEIQYYLRKPKGLSLLAYGQYTLAGRNTGQSTIAGGGIAYQFGLWN